MIEQFSRNFVTHRVSAESTGGFLPKIILKYIVENINNGGIL